MSKGNMGIGLVFIVIGIVGILGHFFNLDFLRPAQLWPFALLIPGLFFEISFFTSSKNAPGILVPGGILTTLGLLFFFETATNWHFSGYTWPVYILAPAIGLFQLFLFTKPRQNALLVPVGVLTLVATISFANMFVGNLWNLIFHNSLIWPVLLIIVGLIIFFGKSNTPNQNL